jgi:hypothetical protein
VGDVFPSGIQSKSSNVEEALSDDDTNMQHLITSFPALEGNDKGESSMLLCTLFRNSSNVLDTYTGGVALLEFDFHVPQEKMGTGPEYPT